MTFFASASLVAVVVSVGLVLLIRKNLRQRPRARELRAVFASIADDIVSKSDLPDAYALQLAELSAVPGGWLTRLMLLMAAKKMITGASSKRASDDLSLSGVPENLRPLYVVAILSLLLSDSYRCAIMGPIWRATNTWVADVFKENTRPDVRADVNAHATRQIVTQISHVHAPRQLRAAERGLEACVA